MKREIENKQIREFEKHLQMEEKSKATIEKYLRDIKAFFEYVDGKLLEKTLILEYKSILLSKYAVTSANSMLAGLNAFFRYFGWYDL